MERRLFLAAMAIVLMAAAGYYVWNLGREPAPTPHEAPPLAIAPPPAPAPSLRYPVEPPQASLPALDASDAAFGNELAQLLGFKSLPEYFYPEEMIRRFVATIDNLPRARASARMMPVHPVPGTFLVSGAENNLALAAANSVRYQVYVALAEKVDPAALAGFYRRWYPLFQQAYVELGYPKGYFNDRLVAVIDDLLDAPQTPARVALLQPHVLYQYADAELEGLSAGQKIMLRMGNENSARVKVLLQALRAQLVQPVGSAGPG